MFRRWVRLWCAIMVMVAASLVFNVAAYAGEDDYPAQWKNAPQDSVFDTWLEYNRECTSFVAFRLSARNGYAMPFHANAADWVAKASKMGIPVDHIAAVGAVAWFSYGHVAWVESVSGDGKTVQIEDYNANYDGKWGERTIDATKVDDFIHFADIVKTAVQPTPLAPPDSDHDGVPDDRDACPHVYVANSTGCPAKSDYSLDGKSDVAAFYNYNGGATNLWLWNGQANFRTSQPYAAWSQASSFDARRLIPAGSADFNGDKMYDTAAFYTYDNGALALDVWYGNTQAGLSPYTAWYTSSGWEGGRVIAAGAGDFNGDNLADVAAFYRYDNNVVSLYIWLGQSDLSMSGPYTAWSGAGWDGSRIVTAGVADVDGDGHADISTFYAHDGGMVDMNVWYGYGTGGFTLGRPWHTDTGWDGTRLIPAGVADLNKDGSADTIMFYRHDNNLVDMRVWWGSPSRIAGDPGGPWSANSWDGSRIIPAGTGDYNGDGNMDIATFYRFDGQATDLNIWYGDGKGNLALAHSWHTDSGWEGQRIVPAAKG